MIKNNVVSSWGTLGVTPNMDVHSNGDILDITVVKFDWDHISSLDVVRERCVTPEINLCLGAFPGLASHTTG